MIQIQISGSTMSDIHAQMRAMLGDAPETAPAGYDVPAPEMPAPEKKPEAPKIDLADVRKACIAYKDKHGAQALKDVLAHFNAKGLPDVPAAKYAELLEAVK